MKGPQIFCILLFMTCSILTCSSEETTTIIPDPDPICYEDGECLNSNLIDVTYPNTTAKCLEDCKNTARCQWVTYKIHRYASSPTFCQLFENCGDFSDQCTNCTSSQVTCAVQQCNIIGRCEVIFKCLILYVPTEDNKYSTHILGITFTIVEGRKC